VHVENGNENGAVVRFDNHVLGQIATHQTALSMGRGVDSTKRPRRGPPAQPLDINETLGFWARSSYNGDYFAPSGTFTAMRCSSSITTL
jgi:hypothetical protein